MTPDELFVMKFGSIDFFGSNSGAGRKNKIAVGDINLVPTSKNITLLNS